MIKHFPQDETVIQECIDVIKKTGKASATLLQRKVWIGWSRASEILDILEERWLVWPQVWAKPREIFIED